MKMPSFSREAAVDFLLQHGEKIVVSVVALLAMGLAWGGIDAIRTQTVTAAKRPEALSRQAQNTLQHIDREKQPPDDVAPKTPSLTKIVEPWRSPQIVAAPEMALLDRPLFEELGKRTKPDVFPIEDLQATAGIAVLAAKNPAGGGMPGRGPEPEKPKAKTGRSKGKKGAADDDLSAGPPPGFGGGMGFGGGPTPAGDGTMTMPPGAIVPYVVVTGLIPVAKQTADYAQRFRATSFSEPKRDSPLWSDYLVERSTVVPGGRETWERIDLKAVAKRARDQWAGVHGEQLPTEFVLGPDQTPGLGAVGYCSPLPQLAMEGWGPEAIHPWFLRELDRLRAERAKAEKEAADRAASGGGPQPEDAGFQSPLAEQPAGVGPGGPLPPGMPLDPMGRPVNDVEYRLFRFVDTAVEPGKSYRYRVRLSVWNPNYNVPGQHLADAALAKDPKLPSQPSSATQAVTVPGPVRVLVRTLPKADMRRYKPGMAEVLVLGPDDRTGNYALRSVITDLGGFVNVDRKLNKTGDQRVRGEEIFTNGVLVDMVGRQENREDLKTPKTPGPPEPLELIVMREDGSLDMVTAADSEPAIRRYSVTLPAADEAKPGAKAAEEPPPGVGPSETPFTFPGIGPR